MRILKLPIFVMVGMVFSLAAESANCCVAPRKEVQIPFDGDRFKYVTFYEAPSERGRTRFAKEDGKLRLEWLEGTKISKAIFSAPLFDGILADLREKELHPVEYVIGIRYDGTDLPQLETYLFTKSKQVKPFYFRLKQGYAEYSVKYGDLPNLDQYQIRGGAKRFTVEKLAFQVKAMKETYRKLELGAMRKTSEVLPGGVTNAVPFGPGELKITAATLAESCRRLAVEAEGTDFPESAYDVEMIVTAPDSSVQRYPVKQVQLNGKENFEIPGIKDINGVYSLTFSVKNSRKSVQSFVVNFMNVKPVRYPYGQKKIYPYPKQMKWLSGYFKAGECSTLDLVQGATARTRRTAELLQEKLRGFGLNYQIAESTGKGIILRIQPDGLKPEGYRLKVTPEKIELTGADERGLYYATVTLHQLMNMEMKPGNAVPVPCVEIVDAPDLKHRVAPFWFPDQVGMPIKERASMDFFLDYIDRFVAGNKMNILKFRGIETLIQYDGEDLPNLAKLNYNQKSRFITWADLERLAKFCSDRFVDLMVTLPAGGHDYWISLYTKYHEKGWSTGDVSHPDYEKIYFTIADKMIKHTGCRYFTASSDEWWHNRKPREEQEDTIRGKTRSQVFLDFHLKLHDFLKERGVRMAMDEDMINPAHNGPRYDTWKIVDSLPRDILVLIWADIGNALKYFGEKGFECWGDATGWITFDQPERKYMTGFGTSLYSFGREWKFRLVEPFSFHSIWFLGANYAWNFNNRSLNWNYSDWMNSGELAAAEAVFAATANPYGGETFEPLDINRFFNASAPAFADGSTTVCNIPMRLGKSSGKNCVETGKDAPQTIPVHRKCSSLVFLHTAIPDKLYKSGKAIHNRMWQRGYPVAEYTVVYADGTQGVYPVHLNQEIYFEDWQPQAGSTVFCRGMKIGHDADRQPHFAYQWELVNPHPEKEIEAIRIAIPSQWNFIHRLMALSIRDVRKQ